MIGCGDVTERKSAPALSLVAQSKLLAVTSRTLSKAEDYAQRHGVDQVYQSVSEMLAKADINAVYIATPPSSHLELAKEVAAAGKACYIEKPMARTHQECEQLVALFAEQNVPLYVAYYRRALPNFLKVRHLLQKQAIGKLQLVSIELHQAVNNSTIAQTSDNWRVRPEIAGGGYFYDLGSHQFDLLEFLLGPIEVLQGTKTNRGSGYAAADTVSASWKFADGVIGTGSWNFASPPHLVREYISIVGEKGEIRFPCFGAGVVTLHQGQHQEEFRFDMPHHIQQPLIELVVQDLLGKGKCPSTGVSAARANHWLEQVVEH